MTEKNKMEYKKGIRMGRRRIKRIRIIIRMIRRTRR